MSSEAIVNKNYVNKTDYLEVAKICNQPDNSTMLLNILLKYPVLNTKGTRGKLYISKKHLEPTLKDYIATYPQNQNECRVAQAVIDLLEYNTKQELDEDNLHIDYNLIKEKLDNNLLFSVSNCFNDKLTKGTLPGRLGKLGLTTYPKSAKELILDLEYTIDCWLIYRAKTPQQEKAFRQVQALSEFLKKETNYTPPVREPKTDKPETRSGLALYEIAQLNDNIDIDSVRPFANTTLTDIDTNKEYHTIMLKAKDYQVLYVLIKSKDITETQIDDKIEKTHKTKIEITKVSNIKVSTLLNNELRQYKTGYRVLFSNISEIDLYNQVRSRI